MEEETMNNNGKDKRPDPKPRKHPQLWQHYLIWNELVEMRKRHTLRISSIEKGKSNLDAGVEYAFLERLEIDLLIKEHKEIMINWGALIPCWEWVTSIRGLKEGSLAAQLLAQIDDIGKFATISKLWRFSVGSVIDGKVERNKKGEVSPFNRKLKSICWLVSDQFVKQQTPMYVDLYYQEKDRQRELHPEKIVVDGKTMYNPGHIDNMAKRKIVKIFLSHLWVVWREIEGLPVSKPYIEQIKGHSNIIEPWRGNDHENDPGYRVQTSKE
jgi:hypothetical protein